MTKLLLLIATVFLSLSFTSPEENPNFNIRGSSLEVKPCRTYRGVITEVKLSTTRVPVVDDRDVIIDHINGEKITVVVDEKERYYDSWVGQKTLPPFLQVGVTVDVALYNYCNNGYLSVRLTDPKSKDTFWLVQRR